MSKNTYWFFHDYEPTSDPKIQAMLGEFNAEGYGFYWRIVEMLHSDDLHKLPRKPYISLAIAKQMQAKVEQVELFVNRCIEVYELFQSDEKFFWSERVNRNIAKRSEISEKRAIAGKNGAIAKQNKAIAKQTLATPSKAKQTQAIIGEDIIEYNTNTVLPTGNVFQNDSLNSAWQDWLKHRKDIRKPCTATAAQRQINKLKSIPPEEALAIIDNSITNGYTGLIFDKGQQSQKQETIHTDEFKNNPNNWI